MLLDKIKETIIRHNLIQKGDNIICAVSGGADSLCLLHVLLKLKSELELSVYAANVNHLIRGEEGDRDSKFVKNVCRAADTPLFYREYDVPKIAALKKLGTEECGRLLRYEFFEEIAKSLGSAKIATGHNLNDNAETIIFRLIRGSAAEGVRGICYRRGNIIRPLLDCKRMEIEEYLKSNSIKWVNDSTNFETLYSRNKIRLEVMPPLFSINKSADEKIVSTALNISEDDRYLNECAEILLSNCMDNDSVNMKLLDDSPIPIKRRAAKKILEKWNVREINTEKINCFLEFANKETGKSFDINSDFSAYMQYGRMVKKAKTKNASFSAVMDTGDTFIHDFWKINIKIIDKPIKKSNNNIAIFDGDKLKGPFGIRYREKGDKMNPIGMTGSKKLADIFSDAKIPQEKRNSTPIVEKDGIILYLCGMRQSSLFKTDRDTNKFLIIEYITKE